MIVFFNYKKNLEGSSVLRDHAKECSLDTLKKTALNVINLRYQSMQPVTVKTHPNIALIKYWGKRNERLHLPTKSSLSVALDAFSTTTMVTHATGNTDQIALNGEVVSNKSLLPIFDFLNLFKHTYGIARSLVITTTNNFPTAAGLASSASGFAALTLALDKFFELRLSIKELSILARRGSGSACRSLFGGFVEWNKGFDDDGCDSIAQELYQADYWPEFCVIIVIVSGRHKKISSRISMQHSVATSPYYSEWLKESDQRLQLMHQALAVKNFESVGLLAEDDCLGMHKTIHTSQPPTTFWTPVTNNIMQLVVNLRTKKNIPCYFTIDAGANVKILCQKNNVLAILAHIKLINGVLDCVTSVVAHAPCTS